MSNILENMEALNLNLNSSKKLIKSIKGGPNECKENSKVRPKPSTDRVNNSSLFNPNKSISLIEQFKNDIKSIARSDSKNERQNLILKKKSYAESIREKNKAELRKKQISNSIGLNTPPKQKESEEQSMRLTERGANAQNLQFSSLRKPSQSYYLFDQKKPSEKASNINENIKSKGQANKNSKSRIKADISVSYASKKSNKENSYGAIHGSSRQKSNKAQERVSTCFSNGPTSHAALRRLNNKKKDSLKAMFNESIQLSQFEPMQTQDFTVKDSKNIGRNNNFFIHQGEVQEFKIEELSQIENDSSNITLVPQVFEYKIDLFSEERQKQEKEVQMLRLHNKTFKKQLALFRKENGAVKKQLQNSKKYIKTLEEKTNQLISLENQSRKQVLSELEASNTKKRESLEEILKQNQNELFETKGLNKTLELKIHMLEKKLAQQEEIHRKKLASEIFNWRTKNNRLRDELLRVRDVSNFQQSAWGSRTQKSQSSIFLESEFQMEISNDEDSV